MTPGQILLKYYHTPLGRVRDSLRYGGPFAVRETERQRGEMEAAAASLPALPEHPGPTPVTLHLMTGRRFWYQTMFCLHSFAAAAPVTVRAELYDDGSLDAAGIARLQRLGPGVQLHLAGALRAKLDAHLPATRFPVLRERWEHYPNIRKLTDVHLGSTGWKLVLDSDLLFFRRPDFLLGWLAAPDRILHAVDCLESYGYSRPLLRELAGVPIPPKVNVGLCGLRSDALDWDQLERWCAMLHAREKTSYYLEQALVALLAARAQPCAVAPAADYVTRPSRAEVLAPRAVMHHYVDTAKRWYFRHPWRRFAGPGAA
jgi:hypothetical protein